MFQLKKKNSIHIPPFTIEGYEFEIIKKNIKHIYFKLNPLKKTIRISAPKRISPDQLNRVILSKKQWLLKQASKKMYSKPHRVQNIFNDKTILFLGKCHPVTLVFKTGRSQIIKHMENGFIITIKPQTNALYAQKLMDAWYRKELKKLIQVIIEKWQPVMDVHVSEFGIKKMKTRWGSCNIAARRIWLNFHLIQLDPKFLEYVVVHEMVHLLEKSHNLRFKNFMNQFIPQWPQLKKELNKHML